MAAVLTFVTYSLSGHELNAAIIFTSLQAFNNIRTPLMLLPLALQSVSDAYVGLQRISKVLLAEEIDNPVPVLRGAKYAVSSHADYSWETATPPDASASGGSAGRDRGAAKKAKAAKKAAKKAVKGGVEPEAADAKEEAVPFSLCVFSL
jgi:ATP-binding cassette subfamily C (CFTR/MRP) protein 1